MIKFDIKNVKEVDSLLLNIIVAPQSGVDPFNACGVTDNSGVVTLSNTFTNDR